MASKQQLYQHKENLSRIIQCLRDQGAMTRRELSAQTSLSWACVSESLSDLIGRGLITEEKISEHQGSGRVPQRLSLCDHFYFLGVDVNEIGLRACTVDLSGRLCESASAPLIGHDAPTLCTSVLRFVEEILKKHPRILGIGLAMQGMYQKEDDLWLFPVDDKRIPLPIRSFLQKHLTLPFHLEHDPNCALLSVATKESSRSLLLRLDHGIGAALRVGDRLFCDGLLEIGESVVDFSGIRLHQIASMRAWDENTTLCKEDFFKQAGEALGTVLGNLCHVFFVDEIILCGSMLPYADLLLPPLKNTLATTYPSPPLVRIATEANPAFGAARLASQYHVY